MDENSPLARRDLPAWITTARVRTAAIITTLAAGASLLGFAQQNRWVGLIFPGPEETLSASPTTGLTGPDAGRPTPSAPSVTPGPDPRPDARRYLAELSPVAGSPNLAPLRGGAASTSLGVPCGTNSSTDQYREVRYRLTSPYERLTAQILTSGVPDPEAAVQIDVLSGRNVVERIVVRGNTTADLVGELTSDLEVALRIACQRPGGLVVLRDASVTRRN